MPKFNRDLDEVHFWDDGRIHIGRQRADDPSVCRLRAYPGTARNWWRLVAVVSTYCVELSPRRYVGQEVADGL
jgi:hypothetical protein